MSEADLEALTTTVAAYEMLLAAALEARNEAMRQRDEARAIARQWYAASADDGHEHTRSYSEDEAIIAGWQP